MARCCGAVRLAFPLLVCLAIALGLAGCSSSKSPSAVPQGNPASTRASSPSSSFALTRSTAAKIIAADPRVGRAWINMAIDRSKPVAQIRAAFDRLKSGGYIEDYIIKSGFMGQFVSISSATAKGKASIADSLGEPVGEEYKGLARDLFDHSLACDNLLFAAWTKADIQVTGIQMIGPGALATYTWQRGEPSPVLGALQEVVRSQVLQSVPAGQRQEGTACLSLYDDGWRVVSCL